MARLERHGPWAIVSLDGLGILQRARLAVSVLMGNTLPLHVGHEVRYRDPAREALRQLVELKDVVKTSNPGRYERERDAAWAQARAALATIPGEPH